MVSRVGLMVIYFMRLSADADKQIMNKFVGISEGPIESISQILAGDIQPNNARWLLLFPLIQTAQE